MAKKIHRRQNIRQAFLIFTWFLFPVVMNFLSPYVIIDGAFQGIITGSFLFFAFLFFQSLILGRAWCGWACPAAGLQEACFAVNDKRLQGKKTDRIKWVIWLIWLGVIVAGFLSAGGAFTIKLLHLTESGISVDAPEKYVIYFIVTGLIFGLSVGIGRRTFCHAACWMAPFMVTGRKIRNLLRTPALQLSADATQCINCKKCTRVCSMSLAVNQMVQDGSMENPECILCGNCIDNCPENVIRFTFLPNRG